VDIVVGAALGAGCQKALIVGDLAADGTETLREDPHFSGPAAALAAALPSVETEWVLLLACDLPHAGLLCDLLAGSFHHLSPGIDGLVALTDFRVQWLAGIYRRSSVETAVRDGGVLEGMSMRTLLGGLKLREVQDPEGLAHDIDTPQDLEKAIRGATE